MLLLCTSLLLSSISFYAASEGEQPLDNVSVVKIIGDGPGYEKIIKGDLNNDGKINSLDYSLAKKLLLETIDINSMDAKQLITIDLNGDENFYSLDLALLQRYTLEIINSFPSDDVEYNVGDLTGDKEYTIEDVQALGNIISGDLKDSSPLTIIIADINKDGVVDEKDLEILTEIINGEYKGFIDFTDEEAEAKHLALYLTDEIFPPEDLVMEISQELSIIRETYGTQLPQIKNIFHWNHNKFNKANLKVEFDDETYEKVINEEYTEWNQLNIEYGLEIIRIQDKECLLIFSDVLNNDKLTELYKTLPGIKSVITSFMIPFRPVPTVGVEDVDGNRKYTFIEVDSYGNTTSHVFQFNGEDVEYINPY